MKTLIKVSLMLTLALGLAATGCGDDKKDDDNEPTVDAGGGGTPGGADDAGGLPVPMCVDNEGVSGTSGTECTGGYAGVTDTQIAENLCDPQAACANLADVQGICTKDPSGKARDVGLPCYLKHSGDADPVKGTGECAFNGEGEAPGLKTVLEGMSEPCITCYVDAVLCAAQKCAADCLGAEEVCAACRDKKGCTGAFFVCSGIKSVPDIQAASK